MGAVLEDESLAGVRGVGGGKEECRCQKKQEGV
jgi:hypothetical protein